MDTSIYFVVPASSKSPHHKNLIMRTIMTSLWSSWTVFLTITLVNCENTPSDVQQQVVPIVQNTTDSPLTGTIKPLTMPCGTTAQLEKGEKVYIESPQYSDNKYYPNSLDCKWRFLFDGCKLGFTCPNFRLNGFLCLDHLEVSDSVGNINRFCGSKGPMDLELVKEANITFRTSAFFSGHGFRCLLNCVSEEEEVPQKPFMQSSNCTCGISSNETRIVNGIETKPGELPWMAGLVRKDNNRPFCGGSVINDRYILTAAHCVSGRTPNNLEVILNLHKTVGTEESTSIRKSVDKIITHKGYTSRLDYDAALIRLSEPINLDSEPVKPICLPSYPDDVANTFAGVESVVSGFGLTSENGPPSPVLLKTDVTVLTNDDCKTKYENAITPRMLCAYAPQRDSCQGDSGGPLQYQFAPESKQHMQIGVVSWGLGCARPNKPANTEDASYCNNSH